MKKLLVTVGILGTLILNVNAIEQKGVMSNYRAVDVSKATILQKGDQKMYCPVCGMTLPLFYKTNHAAKHNGHDKQYCSIHCAVQDKEVNKNNLTDFRVVDNSSLKFIDSNKAYFVVGSKKPATMSMISKYAFGTKEDAQKFVNQFGGKIMMFNELYSSVKETLSSEIQKVNMKQAKAAKKGEMLYNKMCKKIDKRFKSTAEAKAYIEINNICGNMKGKELQMVGLYLGRVE